jgi:toxin secretion/phage lysis holin
VIEVKNNDKGLQAIISAALAAFAVYMGALAVPIIVLMVMMIIDYLSGMSAAGVHGDLSSRVGAKGIVKKVGYMALIVVAMGVDYLIYSGITAANIEVGYNMWFGLLVAVWLIINEMISILENLSKLGVPIPDFLTKIIKRLKNSAERKE